MENQLTLEKLNSTDKCNLYIRPKETIFNKLQQIGEIYCYGSEVIRVMQ